jgi:methylmalonyl-CoA/ethylmalonyl-CoA epimerase
MDPIKLNFAATSPDSPYCKVLEKKGEGIHHIFDVENIEEEYQTKKEGFVVLNSKKGADNKLVVFLHPKSTNGVLIELCQEIK